MKILYVTFTVTLMLFSCCTFAIGQETTRTVETDPETGIMVISEGPTYSSMPESYRKTVTKEQYEAGLRTLPVLPVVIRESLAKRANDRAMRNSIRNIQEAISTFEIISKNEVVASDLEITGEQLTDYRRLKEEYLTLRKDLPKDKIPDLEILFGSKIVGLLLPFQRIEIGRWRASQAGIPKVLTETIVGDAIKLTDAQKSKIREKSQALADEIREFIRLKRIESANLIVEVLDEKQNAELGKIVPPKELNAASNTSVETLWKHHDYQNGTAIYSSKQMKLEPANVWKKQTKQ